MQTIGDKTPFITTDDVIRLPGFGGGFRVWRVIGVHLGGEYQESVLEIIPLDFSLPSANGRTMDSMFVPVQIIEKANPERV